MPTRLDPDLELRTQPMQARAMEAVEAILDATGVLLDETGVDLLTTKAVAAYAQVNIATLYRYFPDKPTLIKAVVSRFVRAQEATLAPAIDALGTEQDWRGALRRVVDEIVRLRAEQPGLAGLHRHRSGTPDVHVSQVTLDAGTVSALATAIRARRADVATARARIMATVTIAIVDGVLDLQADGLDGSAAVSEATAAAAAYLATVLD